MAVIAHSRSGMKINRGAAITTTTTIATTTATTGYPHELGRDLIPELAMRVYSSQLDSFREAISNAFDENSQKVVLSTSNDKITIEDWGNGIKDYDEFRKFGQASKKSRKERGEVIGEKGLGKLSLLNLGSMVCFETNNGKMGIKFYMTLSGFSSPIYKKNTTAFIPHRGTKITITKLATTIPGTDELAAYLKKAFSLRLAQGATIVLNKQAIKPRPNLDPAEQFLFELTKVEDSDANVTGNLKATEDGKGIVDLYIDHVFVTTLEVDTSRKFDGWVNCNALTPETSRNNVVQNGRYREFIFLLRRYTSRFPLGEISVDKYKVMLSRELNALLKSYLKDMRIKVQPQLLEGNVISKGKGGSKFAASQLSTSTGDNVEKKPIRGVLNITKKASIDPSINIPDKRQEQQQQQENIQSNNTIRWEFADLGNEREPIYFVPPNIICCNTSNDLYKFAMEKNRHYGPTWIRMLPYLARIAVAMGTDSESVSCLTPEQLNRKIDEAMRYFLRQKKVI
jgi:hypothetical protein